RVLVAPAAALQEVGLHHLHCPMHSQPLSSQPQQYRLSNILRGLDLACPCSTPFSVPSLLGSDAVSFALIRSTVAQSRLDPKTLPTSAFPHPYCSGITSPSHAKR